ncbi:ABC-three component system protein [Aeromonas enteropelogenes]|uniref:ABC-three component system protein n=1 Tax=Aeromonas enteropelogenes TaxID=29489 RepID=UPI001CCDA330|nr:ABC-three component system protein [Aeromonas enteropelogenes]UBH29555.1 dsDNA nuclease domain-containing protein [Aeromonas enteropelogenes]
MSNVTPQVEKSSAIPAWSGFVYQGKVALYHAIRILLEGNNDANYLKIETLDDFVIHSQNNDVISLHQVKTMQSKYRSQYDSALKQASKTIDRCNSKTTRWFHVSMELDDFSDREQDISKDEYLVKFYSYHDGHKYVKTGDIDSKLNEIIISYLTYKNLNSTPHLIEYKYAKLQMLIAARVNLAHHRNQHENINKFEAADSIPIYLSEITNCLHDEVIHNEDHLAILFEFRKTLLNRTDQILDSLQNELDLDLNGIFKCRYKIANMDIDTLTRLYFSKRPNQKEISLSGFSDNTVDQYLRIILDIEGIKTADDLPYYFSTSHGSYLPTAMKLDRLNKNLDVKHIQENVDCLRGNIIIQNILYDYDNLVVDMASKPFQLSNESSSIGKLMDVFDHNHNRITKINNVRFVSSVDARKEIK